MWQTRSHASNLHDSVQQTAWRKWQAPEILHQRIPTPRPSPKIVLKEDWQAQHDKASQQRTGIEKSIAGQEHLFTIAFRVQGALHEAVLEDSRTNRQDPKVGAHTQNFIQDEGVDHRSTENWCLQHNSVRSQKNHPEFGKDRVIRSG